MARSASGPTLLRNLRLWSGERVDADALLFAGSRIIAIGGATELARRAATAARSIDCGGATAVPGLIDAHVHLELDPEDRIAPTQIAPDVQDRMAERAAAMVNAGITTARDLGGGGWHELRLRDRIAAGAQPGPRLLCAGQPITTPGGHCHFWGGAAHDAESALATLQRQVDHGVDLIKVIATGGRMTAGSNPLRAQFDLATLEAIVAGAAAQHLPVAAHCHGTEGIELAARAGVSSIEHCSWAGTAGWGSDYRPEIAALLLERGIWVSPTINAGWQRMLDNPNGDALGRVRHAYRAMLELGIPFAASTDAGIPGVHHHRLPEALQVFGAIAQLTPEQTLRTATTDSARQLGLGPATGRLAAGLAADILLVDGDPLTDLSALRRPVGIWARGRAIRLP